LSIELIDNCKPALSFLSFSKAFLCSATTASPSFLVFIGSNTNEDRPLNTVLSKPKSLPKALPTASTVFKTKVSGILINFNIPDKIS